MGLHYTTSCFSSGVYNEEIKDFTKFINIFCLLVFPVRLHVFSGFLNVNVFIYAASLRMADASERFLRCQHSKSTWPWGVWSPRALQCQALWCTKGPGKLRVSWLVRKFRFGNSPKGGLLSNMFFFVFFSIGFLPNKDLEGGTLWRAVFYNVFVCFLKI